MPPQSATETEGGYRTVALTCRRTQTKSETARHREGCAEPFQQRPAPLPRKRGPQFLLTWIRGHALIYFVTAWRALTNPGAAGNATTPKTERRVSYEVGKNGSGDACAINLHS